MLHWLDQHFHRSRPALPLWHGRAGQFFTWLGVVVLALVVPILPLVAHQSHHITVPVGLFLLGLGAFLRGEPWPCWRLKSFSFLWVWGFFALLGFASMSALWGPLPLRGFGMSMALFGLVVVVFLGLYGLQGLAFRPTAWLFVVGAFCAAFLFLVEARSGLVLRRSLGLRAELFSLNRGAVGLALLAPFLMVMSWRLGLRTGCLLLGTLLLGALLALSSATAVLLFVASSLLLVTVQRWPSAVGAFLSLAACAGLVLAPWLFPALKPFFHDVGGAWLKGAHVQERLEIWDAFGAVLQTYTPVFGFGLESSWSPQLIEALPTPVLQTWTWLQAGHPHQLFLQVWFEMGLIGVGLCVVLFVLIGMTFWVRATPLRVVLFGQVLLVLSVGHGAWQPWWWASVALAFWLGAFLDTEHEANL